MQSIISKGTMKTTRKQVQKQRNQTNFQKLALIKQQSMIYLTERELKIGIAKRLITDTCTKSEFHKIDGQVFHIFQKKNSWHQRQ